MPRSLSLAALSLLAACRGGRYADDQLEAATVDTEVRVQDGDPDWSAVGRLAVSGQASDWTLDLDGETEAWSFQIHSPARADLGRFAGSLVHLRLQTSWTGAPTGIAVEDETDLAWAVWGPDGSAAIVDRFGGDFVRWGEELGRSRDDGMKHSWRTLSFQTDDGRVELAPGEVNDLRIDGALWRVTVIAAYQEEPLPGTAVPACGGGGDLQSFEIERVAEPAGPDARSRRQGAEMATRSCG